MHIKGSFLTAVVAGVMLWATSASAAGQLEQSGVRGTVRDETGAVLVGAVVTATNLQTGLSISVLSDDRGAFVLSLPDAGEYVVRAVLPGFRSEPSNITIASEEIRTLDMTLALAPLAETVTVTRAAQELAVVSQSVGVALRDDIQVAQRKVSLTEGLRGIPGLFVQDRGNFSESNSLRLSIRAPLRGVGISIRGLQLMQDDIPLTTADGTTQPATIDLSVINRVDVVRGPSSVLYGNVAGGVVALHTEAPSPRPLAIQPDMQFGSNGYQREGIKASGTVGAFGYVAAVSRMTTDGFREHSSAETRQANAVVTYDVSPHTKLRGAFSLVDMPFGESPSTLNEQDARNAPRSVRQLAIDQGLGESSTQGHAGLTVEHQIAGGRWIRSTGWVNWRDAWNPIPFRIIDLARSGAGFRAEYGGSAQLGSVPITYTAGLDSVYQRDDSLEYENEGVVFGDRAQEGGLLIDQLEEVISLSPFVQVTMAPRPQWTVTAGIRYDHYDFDAADRLLADGDQSGSRTMSAFSPTVGFTYAPRPGLNVYGNMASAYETPTAQQLANRPSGEGGFNQDLEPEDLQSFEIGVRGFVEPWRLSYDVAGYISSLDNAFVRFERADEQEFFRNAGRSSRKGIEALVEWRPDPSVSAQFAYTAQRFIFDRFVTDEADFSGNREPGAPPHQLFAGVTYTTAFGLRSVVNVRWMDAYPVNNANTISNWAFRVVDLRFSVDRSWTNLDLRPFFGVDNVLDERYNGSTVPNAMGNRFFEPAPGRQIYVGLTVGTGIR